MTLFPLKPLLFALGLAACLPARSAACGAPARPPAGLLVETADGGALFQSAPGAAASGAGLARRTLGVRADGQAAAGATLWNAGQILTGNPAAKPPQAPRPAPAARRIYTSKDEGNGRVTVAFEWDGLSAPQRALLDLAPGALAPDGLGESRLAYVRGERGREVGHPGGVFRRRVSVLGDAAQGGPLYVGAPSAAIVDGAYPAFYARYKTRRPAVYLGAGDGMLHAFDAADGVELFAYIPDLLIGALNQLGGTGAVLVDGAPAVGEALLAAGWRTVLVAGLDAGAPGVFALDVSDPARFESALWEFGQRDDPAIGKVTAAPAIAKLRVALKRGVAEYRHFALVPSAGTLFLLALDKPPAQPWQLNVNYFKLTPPVAPGAAGVLGPPALVSDADGAARYAYAGDLQGNLWRFDFGGPAPWANGVGFGAGRLPLFVARDQYGSRQPIAQRPQVLHAPGGGYLILFGTGKAAQEGGAADDAQPQSFYAIRDALSGKPAPVGGRDALAARSAGEAADGAWLTVKGAEFRYDGAAARDGWYLDLPGAEASLGGAVLAGDKVFFNTAPAAAGSCAAPGARTYALDALSGLAADGDGVAQSGKATAYLSAEGMRGAPLILTAGVRIGLRDATRRAVATTSYRVLNVTADGVRAVPGAGAAITVSEPVGRMSWREVLNWRELHEAAARPAK